MAYIDTPRTDAGNATYLANGRNIDDLSVEMSFVEPRNKKGDLISQIRGNSNTGPRTPGFRGALLDRPNIAKRGGAGEFTPLLKSATKKLGYKGKENAQVLQTPGFLKTLHEIEEDGALPVSESSVVIASDSDNTDMALRQVAVNNLPNVNSSGIMSTPILGKGKGGRMLEDQQNLMTLREQENIINKTEKENFGLKLKIHHLEEMLYKSDPNLNHEAIRQNTDLRVDRATLQRELHKVKKQLQNSAREADTLRQRMLADQAKSDQQATDSRARKELESLRREVETKEQEIEKLQQRVHSESRTEELENLKGTIEDLEGDLREKERVIDMYQDQKQTDSDQQRRINDLQSELQDANEKIEELQQSQTGNDNLREAAQRTKQDLVDAEEGERQAERERDAAIAESKEQLEEAQSNFRALREKYDLLKDGYKTKSATIQDLESAIADTKADARRREQDFTREIESTRRKHEDLMLAKGPTEERLHDLVRQLNAKTDEKDLLQTRHDALTNESEGLQRDLSKARSENARMQLEVDAERQRSLDQEQSLKEESRKAHDMLSLENSRLRTSLEAVRNRGDSVEEQWQTKCKDLQNQNSVLEKRAANLQQTIDKLQKNEASSSTWESKMQTSLEAEKERHQIEERALQRQIRDLQTDLGDQRTTAEQHRHEASACKEDLKLRMQDLESAIQKQEALEDEIVVLQSSMDQDVERVKRELAQVNGEARTQRNQLSNRESEISQLKLALQSATLEIQSLKEDVHSRSSRKHQTDSRLTELKDLVAGLQTENRTLSSEIKKAKERVQELEKQAHQEQNDQSFIKRDHQGKQAIILDLEAENRAITRQLRSAQDQIKELEVQATIGHKEQSFIKRDQEEKQARIQALQSENRTLSTRLAESLERVKDVEAQARADEGNRELFRHNYGKNQSQVQELQFEKKLLATSLSKAQACIKELEFQVKTAHLGSAPTRYDSDGQLRETPVLNRETSYKIEIARLEEKVADLRDQLRNQHHKSPAPVTPARSPVLASFATPNEIAELRSQLDNARQQSKVYRDQIHGLEKKARKQAASLEMAAHDQDEEVWRLRRDLEKKSDDLQLGQAELAKIREAVDKSSSKLRARIQELEQDLRQARLVHTEDDTIAMERQDLHDMLKSAKLEAEELRVQLSEHLAQVNASQEREKILRSNIQKIRNERAEQQQRVASLSDELSRLQDRYDDKVEELYHQANRVDLPQTKDKRTSAEMKGLAKQIEWLKQNLAREKNFRHALAYEKHYYLQQIDMYNACNAVDIQLLKQIGCYTKAPKKTKTKSLRPVANMIIALVRMRNISSNWTSDQKQHADYLKKVDQARGKRRASGMKR